MQLCKSAFSTVEALSLGACCPTRPWKLFCSLGASLMHLFFEPKVCVIKGDSFAILAPLLEDCQWKDAICRIVDGSGSYCDLAPMAAAPRKGKTPLEICLQLSILLIRCVCFFLRSCCRRGKEGNFEGLYTAVRFFHR